MVGCPEKKLETALGNEEVVGVAVLGRLRNWCELHAVIFFRTTIIYYHTGCVDCRYVFL